MCLKVGRAVCKLKKGVLLGPCLGYGGAGREAWFPRGHSPENRGLSGVC